MNPEKQSNSTPQRSRAGLFLILVTMVLSILSIWASIGLIVAGPEEGNALAMILFDLLLLLVGLIAFAKSRRGSFPRNLAILICVMPFLQVAAAVPFLKRIRLVLLLLPPALILLLCIATLCRRARFFERIAKILRIC